MLVSAKLSASHDFILTYLLNSLKTVLCIPNRNTSFRKSAPNIMVDNMRAFLFLVVVSSHTTWESLKASEQTYFVVYNDKCVQTFSYSHPYFLLFNLAKYLSFPLLQYRIMAIQMLPINFFAVSKMKAQCTQAYFLVDGPLSHANKLFIDKI